jgi:hypothetical protein
MLVKAIRWRQLVEAALKDVGRTPIVAAVPDSTYQQWDLLGCTIAKRSNLIVSRDAVFDPKGKKL